MGKNVTVNRRKMDVLLDGAVVATCKMRTCRRVNRLWVKCGP